MTKLKQRRWRDRVYEWLSQQPEPCSTEQIFLGVKTKQGHDFRNGPENLNAASQYLAMDGRFRKLGYTRYKQRAGAKSPVYRHRLWEVIDDEE